MPGHKLPARSPEDEIPPDEIRDDMLRRCPTLEPCLPPSGERAASGPDDKCCSTSTISRSNCPHCETIRLFHSDMHTREIKVHFKADLHAVDLDDDTVFVLQLCHLWAADECEPRARRPFGAAGREHDYS